VYVELVVIVTSLKKKTTLPMSFVHAVVNVLQPLAMWLTCHLAW